MEYDYNTNKGTHRSPLIVRILIFLLFMTAGAAVIGVAGIILYGGGLFVVEADRDHTEHSSLTEEWQGTALPSPLEKTEAPENSEAHSPATPAQIQTERNYPGSGESLTLIARDGQGGEVWSYTAECGSRISANGSVYDTLEWMENGDIVYINNASAEQLIAIDRSSGSELWRLNGCFGCPIVYDFGADGTLYIGSANEFYGPAVVAVSADGQELWRMTEYYTTTDITVREDHVSVDFDDWGYCYTVNFDFDGNRI